MRRKDRETARSNAPGAAGTAGGGFTLIELLIVVSIIALLTAILMPGLRDARNRARSSVCASNIRQLVVANTGYASEHQGRLCPGAADFAENRHRWHGARDSATEPFDPARGPLVVYLTADGAVRHCPSFADFLEGRAAFEKGCGGYGYNQAFIGRVVQDAGFGFFQVATDRIGVLSERIRSPGETLMFADAAFAASTSGVIEYSFAEPRYHPTNPRFRTDPSIHFRHQQRASAAWSDGHVDQRRRTFSWSSGLYLGDPASAGIGWFGESDDNRYFDLQ